MKPIYTVNPDFFKVWTPQMSYILGFTCADGCVYRRTLSWELSNKDDSERKLLEIFNKAMNSNYPIETKQKSVRLRISHPEILRDLVNLKIVPNKTKILSLPEIPEEYLRHFLRGFLDGDGWITAHIKGKGTKEISVGFSNGSYEFMSSVSKIISSKLDIAKINLRERNKITKKGKNSRYYMLELYSNNALKIIKFLYECLSKEDIYLERKYQKQLLAKDFFQHTQKIKSFGNKWIKIEKECNKKMSSILNREISENKKIPREIAKELNISLATLYRWLEKSKVRIPEKKGSKEWSERIIDSKNMVLNGR